MHFGQLVWIQGTFYGIAAAVSAIIVRSTWNLIQKTLSSDLFVWILFAAPASSTVWTESEIVWLFVLPGFVALFAKSPRHLRGRSTEASLLGPGLLAGLLGPASLGTVALIFLTF